MRSFWLGLCLAPCLVSGGAPAAAQSLDWQVIDRFRLWDRARSDPHRMSLEQLLERVAYAEGPDAVEDAVLAFTSSQSELHRKSYWDPTLETYDREYVWPLSYRVRVTTSGLTGVCRWTTDHGSFAQDQGDCAGGMELSLPANGQGDGSVTATVTVRFGAGELSLPIRVRDRLIASIGDSFASGEGNPDQPMDLSRLPRAFAESETDGGKTVRRSGWTSYRHVTWQGDEWTNRWLGREDVAAAAGAADWWDPRCHRSFFSQHLVAALRYSAQRPKEAVTFVTYACSGAETFRGLLSEQAQPPGYGELPGFDKLAYPQVEVLVANMCPPHRQGTASRHLGTRNYLRRFDVPRYHYAQASTWACRDDAKPRRIDALLVSIGGNDVGFGPVIQDALLPRAEEIAPDGRRILGLVRRGAVTPIMANGRILRELPENYEHLRARLREVLAAGTPVLQSAYPNPLYDEGRRFCAADDAGGLAAFEGVWPDAGVDPNRRWRMEISEQESRNAQDLLITPLDGAVRAHVAAGSAAGWRLVDDFQPVFERRGWCATAPGEPPLPLPNWDAEAGRWAEWSPAAWSPYQSRARLFRTPNDAAMTQQPAARRRVFGPLSRLLDGVLQLQQETLMSSSSGAFHPTFEAHAIMGWSVGAALLEALPPT